MQQAKENPRLPPPVFLTEQLFEELVTLWHQNQMIPEDLMQITEQSIFPLSLPMKALNEFRMGHWRECLNFCYGLYQYQPVLPNHFIGLMADSAQRCGRHWEMSWPFLQFAEAALDEGNYSLAMAAIKQIFMFSGDRRMLNSATALQRISRVLTCITSKLPAVEPKKAQSQNGKLRIALVNSSLVDHVPASGRLALQFTRHIDRDLFDPYIYVTQPTLATRPQEFAVRFDDDPVEETGKDFLRRLKRSGVSVQFSPPDEQYHMAALWLAQRLIDDKIDVAIFCGGVNDAIMYVTAHLAPVPVKLNICTGVAMYSNVTDATIYFSSVEKERDAGFWKEEWGKQIYLEATADPAEARRTQVAARSTLKLPEDSIVYGALIDDAGAQLDNPFLETVAAILKDTPKAHFVCAATGNCRPAKEKLKDMGVERQCIWLDRPTRTYAVLKLMDVYLNPFPEGGSLSVREAVACKVPVIAMRTGISHCAKEGVAFLGRTHTLPADEVNVYRDRAVAWATDLAMREKVAEAQYRRLVRYFPVHSVVDRLVEVAGQFIQGR